MTTSSRIDLPLRSSADTTGEVARVLSKLEGTGQNLTILRLLANSSVAFRPFVLLSSALLHGAALPPDVREVVILTLGARQKLSYEWVEHVPIAKRVGVSDEQIKAIEQGDPTATLSEEQRLALAIVDEVEKGQLSPGLWDAAVAAWGQQAGIELVLTIGWWGGLVPAVIRAFGLSGDHVGA